MLDFELSQEREDGNRDSLEHLDIAIPQGRYSLYAQLIAHRPAVSREALALCLGQTFIPERNSLLVFGKHILEWEVKDFAVGFKTLNILKQLIGELNEDNVHEFDVVSTFED